MKVFIVYAHPSEDSFTRFVRDEFIKGLKQAGHTYEISDLYKMEFQTDISEAEYLREANYEEAGMLSDDVIIEQSKINSSDAIAFIYPVFWTEAPAKLVGWFDRVWTYGFAYGDRKMKLLGKALVICVAGRTEEHLALYGHLDSMKKVMLGDRIFDRAVHNEMILLDGMSKANNQLRLSNWDRHLKTAFYCGLNV